MRCMKKREGTTTSSWVQRHITTEKENDGLLRKKFIFLGVRKKEVKVVEYKNDEAEDDMMMTFIS